ncbi:hypothetical protein GCM10027610_034220 [Dactylosporangium cerinum]
MPNCCHCGEKLARTAAATAPVTGFAAPVPAYWASTPGCGIITTSGGLPPATRDDTSTLRSLPPEVYRTRAPVWSPKARRTRSKFACSAPVQLPATSTDWPL